MRICKKRANRQKQKKQKAVKMKIIRAYSQGYSLDGFANLVPVNEQLAYLSLPFLDDGVIANGLVINSVKIQARPILSSPAIIVSNLYVGKLKPDGHVQTAEFGAVGNNVLAICSAARANSTAIPIDSDVLINEAFLYTKSTDKFFSMIEGNKLYFEQRGTTLSFKVDMIVEYSRILMNADEILASRM